MPKAAKGAKEPVTAVDYSFDIFISYAHEENLKYWVQQFFSPELKSGISNHLNRKVAPRIFLDRWEIRSGDEWRKRLGSALSDSIYFIPILTADYFRSRWCRVELDAFLRRERKLGLVGRNGEGGLVFPVQWVKFEVPSRQLSAKQLVDMSQWSVSAPAFKQSHDYLNFQRAVRDFSRRFCDREGYLQKPPVKAPLPIRRQSANVRPPRTMKKPGF